MVQIIKLPIEQQLQMIEIRRQTISRAVFEFELDIVVMTSQGRTDDVLLLRSKIEEFKNADLSLQEFSNRLLEEFKNADLALQEFTNNL